MQAAERAHNLIVDFSLQTTSTVSSRCRDVDHLSMSTSDSSTATSLPITCRTVAIHRRWVDLSVDDDHRCCRKPHVSLRSYSLTGTIC